MYLILPLYFVKGALLDSIVAFFQDKYATTYFLQNTQKDLFKKKIYAASAEFYT